MKKSILFILLVSFQHDNLYAEINARNLNHPRSKPLAKMLVQKSDVTTFLNDQHQENEFDCSNWKKPEDSEITTILNLMRPLEPDQWHYCYGDWECSKEGTLIYQEKTMKYSLDAAGTLILFGNGEQLYFGCFSPECWSYFAEGASSACDSLGNANE